MPNFLFYEGPTTVNFTPNCFTDIENVLEKKLGCLKAHASQVAKTNIEDQTILELALSCANFRGIQARVKYRRDSRAGRVLEGADLDVALPVDPADIRAAVVGDGTRIPEPRPGAGADGVGGGARGRRGPANRTNDSNEGDETPHRARA